MASGLFKETLRFVPKSFKNWEISHRSLGFWLFWRRQLSWLHRAHMPAGSESRRPRCSGPRSPADPCPPLWSAFQETPRPGPPRAFASLAPAVTQRERPHQACEEGGLPARRWGSRSRFCSACSPVTEECPPAVSVLCVWAWKPRRAQAQGLGCGARPPGRGLRDRGHQLHPSDPLPDSVGRGKNARHAGPAGGVLQGVVTRPWRPGSGPAPTHPPPRPPPLPPGDERTRSAAVARRGETCFWLTDSAEERDCRGQQEDSGTHDAFRSSGEGARGARCGRDPAPWPRPHQRWAGAACHLCPPSVPARVLGAQTGRTAGHTQPGVAPGLGPGGGDAGQGQ